MGNTETKLSLGRRLLDLQQQYSGASEDGEHSEAPGQRFATKDEIAAEYATTLRELLRD